MHSDDEDIKKQLEKLLDDAMPSGLKGELHKWMDHQQKLSKYDGVLAEIKEKPVENKTYAVLIQKFRWIHVEAESPEDATDAVREMCCEDSIEEGDDDGWEVPKHFSPDVVE